MGAGHYESTVFPGDFGNSVLFGHRDTVFRCLKDVKKRRSYGYGNDL